MFQGKKEASSARYMILFLKKRRKTNKKEEKKQDVSAGSSARHVEMCGRISSRLKLSPVRKMYLNTINLSRPYNLSDTNF